MVVASRLVALVIARLARRIWVQWRVWLNGEAVGTKAVGTKKEKGNGSHSPSPCSPYRKGMGQGILAPRRHRNKGAALFLTAERHFALNCGEDRVVPSHTDVGTGVELSTPLAHQNIAGDNDLAAELLDAEPPARAIATVAGAAACFLVCHGTVSPNLS